MSAYSGMFSILLKDGPVVVWLKDRPGDRRVAGSILESTDFLTNSSRQARHLGVHVHRAVLIGTS